MNLVAFLAEDVRKIGFCLMPVQTVDEMSSAIRVDLQRRRVWVSNSRLGAWFVLFEKRKNANYIE